jgi:hypothetical protein
MSDLFTLEELLAEPDPATSPPVIAYGLRVGWGRPRAFKAARTSDSGEQD